MPFIEVNLSSFDKASRRMIRAGANVRPAFAKARGPLRKATRDQMRGQFGPNKKPWKSLAPSTRERRLRTGGKANKFTKRGKLKKRAQRTISRVLSKRLITKAKIEVKRKHIKITSAVKWAGIHQRGGRAGKRSKIPKRPFLYFSRDLQNQIRKNMAEHLAKNFNG